LKGSICNPEQPWRSKNTDTSSHLCANTTLQSHLPSTDCMCSTFCTFWPSEMELLLNTHRQVSEADPPQWPKFPRAFLFL
jgi:hypothetical protein